jgi:uncharacterized lipoprotein YddW (UPF0748 family)
MLRDMTHRAAWTLGAAMILLVNGCAATIARSGASPESPPEVQREMRGLWIATVGNIDWPSRKGLSEEAQKRELTDLLDRAARTGINAIVFHVRPAGDALYRSSLEPWAAWLTGTQGGDPGYDPLEFAIAEAHARGMQLHAWINPFRAGNSRDSLLLAPTHVFHERRDLVRVYGSQLWMDPGEPESQERSIAVIDDIVRRYDVDGVHVDDYFYPYEERDSAQKLIPFPDDSTYAKYGEGIDRGDWRRANIDRFIERMYREVHAIKPSVVVGISPFGIWRPGNPASVQGLDAFASIYADSKKWLQSGWVDYFAPQLYWAIGAEHQSFPQLLDWWVQQDTLHRYVWPGLAAYRVDAARNPLRLDEMPAQVAIVREREPLPGEILYNTKSTLLRNGGKIGKTLASGVYAKPAIVPPFVWLDSIPPAAPHVIVSGGTLMAQGDSVEPARAFLTRIHQPARWTWLGPRSARWTTRLDYGPALSIFLDRTPDVVLVQAVDAAGNVGPATSWRRP